VGTIILNNHSFSFDAIRQQGTGLLKETDASFYPAFTLAQQWLNNQQLFTFFTSGSTGIPKKIELQRGQLLASAKGTIETLGLTSAEHILLCMNPAFIGGAMLLIRGLELDATITLQEPSGDPLQYIPVNHPYTFVSFAPLQLFALLQLTQNTAAKLNLFSHILVGGAPISFQLEQQLTLLKTNVYHTYGMTETVSHIALRRIGKENYFTILKGVSIRTDDRHCLAIQSASTQGEWIQTNDVVNLLSENSFEMLGRADDVINSGGIKLWPAKIETALYENLGNTAGNLFVTGIPDERLGQQIIAVIESEKDRDLIIGLLDRGLPSLGKYEIPKQIFVLERFVYTPTGKINKAETLKMIDL
jgi:O-succinylbenzoic acid--CoA ligase